MTIQKLLAFLENDLIHHPAFIIRLLKIQIRNFLC